MVSLLTSKYPDSYYGYLEMVKLMLKLHHRSHRMVKLVIGFYYECSSSDLEESLGSEAMMMLQHRNPKIR